MCIFKSNNYSKKQQEVRGQRSTSTLVRCLPPSDRIVHQLRLRLERPRSTSLKPTTSSSRISGLNDLGRAPKGPGRIQRRTWRRRRRGGPWACGAARRGAAEGGRCLWEVAWSSVARRTRAWSSCSWWTAGCRCPSCRPSGPSAATSVTAVGCHTWSPCTSIWQTYYTRSCRSAPRSSPVSTFVTAHWRIYDRIYYNGQHGPEDS